MNNTETKRFQAWYEAEKANGLLDVKFFLTHSDDATAEDFFAELNRALNAEPLSEREHL